MAKRMSIDKTISPKLGQYIRSRREELDMTQYELGKKVGYRYGNFVAMLERGVAMFPFDAVFIYADALQIPRHTMLRVVMEELYPEYVEVLDFKESRAEIRRRKRIKAAEASDTK